jgi:hypothetical protein
VRASRAFFPGASSVGGGPPRAVKAAEHLVVAAGSSALPEGRRAVPCHQVLLPVRKHGIRAGSREGRQGRNGAAGARPTPGSARCCRPSSLLHPCVSLRNPGSERHASQYHTRRRKRGRERIRSQHPPPFFRDVVATTGSAAPRSFFFQLRTPFREVPYKPKSLQLISSICDRPHRPIFLLKKQD